MTTRYKNVQIYVDPKDHKELKKKLKKEFAGKVSLSQFVRVTEDAFLNDLDFIDLIRLYLVDYIVK